MKYTVYSQKFLSNPIVALETNDLKEVIEYYFYYGKNVIEFRNELDKIIKKNNDKQNQKHHINIKQSRVNTTGIDGEKINLSINTLIETYVQIYEYYQKSFTMNGIERKIYEYTLKQIWKVLPKLDGEITAVHNNHGEIIGTFGTEK
jgi:hypothetical protein